MNNHKEEHKTTKFVNGKIGNIAYNNIPIEDIPEEHKQEILDQDKLHRKLNVNTKIGALVQAQDHQNYQTLILASIISITAKQHQQKQLNDKEQEFLNLISEADLDPLSLIPNIGKVVQIIASTIHGK